MARVGNQDGESLGERRLLTVGKAAARAAVVARAEMLGGRVAA